MGGKQTFSFLRGHAVMQIGSEEGIVSLILVRTGKNQVMHTEIVLEADDIVLRNQGHDFPGKGGIIEVLIQLGPKLKIQRGGFRLRAVCGQEKKLDPPGAQEIPEHIPQVHHDQRLSPPPHPWLQFRFVVPYVDNISGISFDRGGAESAFIQRKMISVLKLP